MPCDSSTPVPFTLFAPPSRRLINVFSDILFKSRLNNEDVIMGHPRIQEWAPCNPVDVVDLAAGQLETSVSQAAG